MTTTYATQVTQYYLNQVAAAEAGGPAVNLAGGSLIVGDGNGVVPSISALIAANGGAGGVLHQVWSGSAIQAVYVDANNAAQLDISCVIPAAIGGVEIGPFTVREFAILDASNMCCVVGTTNLEKTTSAQGQVSDLAWIAAIVEGVGSVTVTPPSAGFTTITEVITEYNGALCDAVAPLTKTDTTVEGGWIKRTFGLREASQPADPVTLTLDANAIGSGRPASDAEFAAGAATAGGFPWPWPTIAQVKNAITNAITIAINTLTTWIISYADVKWTAVGRTASHTETAYNEIIDLGGSSNFTTTLMTPVNVAYAYEINNASSVAQTIASAAALFTGFSDIIINSGANLTIPPGATAKVRADYANWCVIEVLQNATTTSRGLARQATPTEAQNRATTGETPAFVRPEDLPIDNPFTITGIGAVIVAFAGVPSTSTLNIAPGTTTTWSTFSTGIYTITASGSTFQAQDQRWPTTPPPGQWQLVGGGVANPGEIFGLTYWRRTS